MSKTIQNVRRREGGNNNLVVRAWDARYVHKSVEDDQQLSPTANNHIDSLVEVLVEALTEIETLRQEVTTLREQLDTHTFLPHFGATEFLPKRVG